MSSQPGSSQPTAGKNDKQPQKPPASYSSFIIKDKTKKFAPKAIQRRRPAASQASQPTASDATNPEPTPPFEQSQPDAPAAESTQAESTVTAPAASEVQQPSGNDSNETQTQPDVAPEPSEPSQVTPAPVSTEQQPSALTAPTPPETDAEPEEGRSPKRRRLETTHPTTTPTIAETLPTLATPAVTPAPEAAPSSQVEKPTETVPPAPSQPITTVTETVIPTETPEVVLVAPTVTAQNISTEEARPQEPTTTAGAPAGQKRKRRLPWVAVNDPERGPEEPPVRAKTVRKPSAKAKGKRRATSEEVAQQDDEGTDSAAATPRPTAKARGKRKGTSTTAQDDTEAQPTEGAHTAPAKKPRKVRKDKGTKRKRRDAPTEEAEQGDGEVTEDAPAAPKRRRVKKSTATPGATTESGAEAGGEGDAQEEGNAPRRRGRARETTPEDAEDREIDPAETLMEQLARRESRIGKISSRELKMREINWAEVRQQQRDRELALTRETDEDRRARRNAFNEAFERAGNERAAEGEGRPRYREVDGKIMLVEDSTTVDNNANVAAEMETVEAVEEDDLRQRINTQSFLMVNKRDPAERTMIGRGKRWTADETEQFYDGLTMFGTDFGMISTMFPGKSRMNVKTKFNREERENPERIKQVLAGERVTDFKVYLQLTGTKEDDYTNVEELEREMDEIEQDYGGRIDQAKKDYEETQRQKALAGAESSEGEGEDGKKKKKKKKEREKKKSKYAPVGGEEEIVEELGDDER